MKDIKFDRSSFWVQVHGLLTMCQIKEVCVCLGSGEGECQWERFLLGEFSAHKGSSGCFLAAMQRP